VGNSVGLSETSSFALDAVGIKVGIIVEELDSSVVGDIVGKYVGGYDGEELGMALSDGI
jgi:hypothetical protein